jgi:MFS family permease
MYPPSTRPRAIAWYGVAAGIGSIAGQVLGGLLVSTNIAGLGWRVIFLVNVPVGVIAAALAWRMLPSPRIGRRPGLDPIGALGIAVSLALILVPLSLGRTEGWPAWTWACLASAVPVTFAVLHWERRLARRGGAPVLPTALLRRASFRAGMLASAAFNLYFGSFMFTLTLLLQGGLGLSPLEAGLAFTPAGITFSASALVARWLVARWGLRALLLACGISAGALALLLAAVNQGGASSSVPFIMICAALMSLGNSVTAPSLIGATLVDVTADEAGAGAGVLITAQQFASSAGVALIGTIFFAGAQVVAGADDYPRGMIWSGLVDVLLVAAVAALLVLVQKAARRGEPA